MTKVPIYIKLRPMIGNSQRTKRLQKINTKQKKERRGCREFFFESSIMNKVTYN